MKKPKKSPKIDQKTQSVIDAFHAPTVKSTDPDGSYTGVPKNEKEQPVQDADDL